MMSRPRLVDAVQPTSTNPSSSASPYPLYDPSFLFGLDDPDAVIIYYHHFHIDPMAENPADPQGTDPRSRPPAHFRKPGPSAEIGVPLTPTNTEDEAAVISPAAPAGTTTRAEGAALQPHPEEGPAAEMDIGRESARPQDTLDDAKSRESPADDAGNGTSSEGDRLICPAGTQPGSKRARLRSLWFTARLGLTLSVGGRRRPQALWDPPHSAMDPDIAVVALRSTGSKAAVSGVYMGYLRLQGFVASDFLEQRQLIERMRSQESSLLGLIIADQTLVTFQHHRLRTAVLDFVRRGGVAVTTGLFARASPSWAVEAFFHEAGLTWKIKDRTPAREPLRRHA
ncbi:hypothetical protein GMORB2_4776 [Geosmithia morbida]|uniref:Uncharacterized protein n=1 Tax=Geosmithia morbida TaxID=1094350 RepID=A0A9P5D2E5_9HYPO|nr:uncharacterized protein GMORB2_4776 [Geosmithia morbida]KAF4119434.1 hypothetical protein GMORB2_4776 [Geosmithia morbida]